MILIYYSFVIKEVISTTFWHQKVKKHRNIITSVPNPLKKLSTWARSLSVRTPLLSGLRLWWFEFELELLNRASGVLGLLSMVQSGTFSKDSEPEPSDESLGGTLSPMELSRERILVWDDICKNKIKQQC